jgi:hypothetical protein
MQLRLYVVFVETILIAVILIQSISLFRCPVGVSHIKCLQKTLHKSIPLGIFDDDKSVQYC